VSALAGSKIKYVVRSSVCANDAKPRGRVSLVGSFRFVFRDFSSLRTPFLACLVYTPYMLTAYVKHQFSNGRNRHLVGDNVRVQKDVVTDSFVERLEDNAVFVCFVSTRVHGAAFFFSGRARLPV
jgi:hypothetical protein